MSKYDKSVSLHCPVCGHTQFKLDKESEIAECADCGNELSKDELISENSENIQTHVNEIKDKITQDLIKSFKRKFK